MLVVPADEGGKTHLNFLRAGHPRPLSPVIFYSPLKDKLN